MQILRMRPSLGWLGGAVVVLVRISFVLPGTAERCRTVEQLAQQNGIGSDDPCVIERLTGIVATHAQAEIEAAATGDQLPKMLGFDSEEPAWKLIGLGEAAFD